MLAAPHRWFLFYGLFIASLLLLASCSGNNGFQLRGSTALAEQYQKVFLKGIEYDSYFGKVLQRAFEEAGSELVSDPQKASAYLELSSYIEGKKVAAYGADREVKEYLIYLRSSYMLSKPDGSVLLPQRKINLDKIQIYDSAYVLGKVEEERLIKEDLRKNAARQILLRLQYAK